MAGLTIPDIRYSTYIAAAPQRVYWALTTAEGWNSWFTRETTVDFRPGGSVSLRWRDWGVDHETVDDGGPIVEIEPNRVFAFLWNRGTQATTVRFVLEPLGSGTRLTVTDSGQAQTQRDLDVAMNCACGWGEALALLKFFLEHGITYGTVPKQ